MRESRYIIIFSCLLGVLLIPIFFCLKSFGVDEELNINIITNLSCGIIVGLVTAICQFFSARKKIINNIYGAYFDVYRSYYYAKNKPFLCHYNSIGIYKKMVELNPKIIESLDEYHGLFTKYDRTYKRLNPSIIFNKNYRAKIIIKSFTSWFNKKYFNEFFEPFICDVEKILVSIDEKRFEKDKVEMIRMFNCIWDKK